MFKVFLNNDKSFLCNSDTTILEAAKNSGFILEHSCLTGRCKSCAIQMIKGSVRDRFEDTVLTEVEKANNWVLSCNAIPTSDVILDIEDLKGIKTFEKKIIPAKIQSITYLIDNVIKVSLRLPPNSNFGYNPGQYVNIIKGHIKRSYSIANAYQGDCLINFIIKRYENGSMSNFWFKEAKVNDLVRIEGPLGTFFFRDTELENIVFLATGTGVAPIKAILENLSNSINQLTNKNFWLFIGARYENDLIWNPSELSCINNFKYIPVLSRGSKDWNGEIGYVQDIVLKQNISLSNAQVYACGSNNMIESAKKLFLENGLERINFLSDAFVATN